MIGQGTAMSHPENTCTTSLYQNVPAIYENANFKFKIVHTAS